MFIFVFLLFHERKKLSTKYDNSFSLLSIPFYAINILKIKPLQGSVRDPLLSSVVCPVFLCRVFWKRVYCDTFVSMVYLNVCVYTNWTFLMSRPASLFLYSLQITSKMRLDCVFFSKKVKQVRLATWKLCFVDSVLGTEPPAEFLVLGISDISFLFV